MVTPFAPSLGWMSVYVREAAAGHEEACRVASRAVGLSDKEYARTPIAGGMLTVPVEGGAHGLKSRQAYPLISEHGKWRREHAGALLAAYGRTPFYRHLLPELEAIYTHSAGKRLEDFNREILELILTWLDPSVIANPKFAAIQAELRLTANPHLSILDPLFHQGPQTAFLL